MSEQPMKLIDALRIAGEHARAGDRPRFRVALVCGFTPLHLQTFFTAHLCQRLPDRHLTLTTGLFDDIPGTLRGLRSEPVDAAALVVEWADLDPRLGIRRLGGWSPQHLPEVVDRAGVSLAQLQSMVREVATTTPVVIALPTLPLPPLFFTARWQAGSAEADLKAQLWNFAAAAAKHPRIRIVNPDWLDAQSAPGERLGVDSAWRYGFPYEKAHAERLAAALACGIENPQPKKGLITDLDDTLWAGIVGDDGVDAIQWDLDHSAQAHGLYQQLLSTLSEEGVLVAVASKNDPSVVDQAFSRPDLLLRKERIFPIAAGWGSKAEAVGRVLTLWNVGADSVVFVDDNATELAEVKAAYPEIDCLQFPRHSPQHAYALLNHLRTVFGRNALSDEDALRVASLRAGASARDFFVGGADGYSEALLEQADAEVVLDFGKDPDDRRAYELVCKTNQFNLNGRRPTERAWSEHVRDEGAFVLTASYTDRFGALGKIAVVAGRAHDARLQVDTWVMSCRAFARRIEYQCLKALFDRFEAREVAFDFRETERNAPIVRFLTSLQDQAPGTPLSADQFRAVCPRLFHRVVFRDACPAGT
jgi:FkbH-like protein